ncbi:hypothetical protein [Homoserinimonas aerilata]|uniref:hypothetical protein n=1 Tax=Homoserinimonas aerilata TaxID=1162970 RepID=UPI001154F717|nr:hypothetical protein [Homoserinimonas aerilata]
MAAGAVPQHTVASGSSTGGGAVPLEGADGTDATVAPDAPRAVSKVACDRVHASADRVLCLHTDRRLGSKFEAKLYDNEWNELGGWPLRGCRVAPASRRIRSCGRARPS